MRAAAASLYPCLSLVTPRFTLSRKPAGLAIALSRAKWRSIAPSKPKFCPNCPGLQRRNQFVRQTGNTVELTERFRPGRFAAQKARQQPCRRRDHRCQHLVAVPRPQRRTQIADRVGEAKR